MICDDLKVLFPKYTSMSYHRDSLTIKEDGHEAKIREVVWTNSDFQNIDQLIVKDFTSFFQTAGAAGLFYDDCDNIMMFEKDGQKYLVFSELKSNFDSQDVYHAKDQIISSYLKINLLLNLIPNYKTEDFIVKGFIFSYPPDQEYLRELYRKQMFKPGSKYKAEAEFILDLCYQSTSTTLTPLSCHKLKGLPLGERGIFQKMEIHHIQVPKGESSITLDVQQYI